MHKVITNTKQVRIWKEVMTSFRVLSQNMPWESEENHEKLHGKSQQSSSDSN